MNVFEFAMQMEKDGEAYYRKMAGQAGNAVLKKVLDQLADDEVKHYNIFKKFRDGDFSGVPQLAATGTTILNDAKNVFQELSAGSRNFSFGTDITDTWKEAQAVEKKSEDFYREKAAKETNEDIKKTLNIIADEEHKHWTLIEHILQFVQRPRQWLEDAEWNHLEDY
ncbi:MAG: ferritin family protein [candidate division Zixibacteria bacterium]|nr:ferritin family protein [candidate division Zixibacteria bacterium]